MGFGVSETLISFFQSIRPMRSRKLYSTDKLGRIRYKGKIANKTQREEYIKQNYRAHTDKRGRVSIRQPDGRFAKIEDIEVYRQVPRRKPTLKKITATEGKWQDGKVLKSAYYFNFFCRCIVKNPRKSPVTYIDDGDYIREHFFGFATRSLNNVEQRARAKHNKNFSEHKIQDFSIVEKKKMSV